MSRKLVAMWLVLALVLVVFAACGAQEEPTPVPPTVAPVEPTAVPEDVAEPVEEPTEPAEVAEPTAVPEPTEEPAPVEEKEPITISIWDIYPEGQPSREVLDNAIARFNAKYPYVTVEVTSYAIADFKTKLVTALAANAAPDVFQTWGGGTLFTYGEQGQAADLTPYFEADPEFKDRITDAGLSFVTSPEGKIYGVPLETSPILFFYNTELFEANGVEAPQTFDDLLNACSTLNAAGIAPISLAMNKATWTGDFFYVYLVNRVGGTELFENAALRNPGGSFADPAFVKAGELLQQMVDAQCFQEGFMGAEYASQRQLLGQETAAMTLMGTWLPGQMESEFPEVYPKLDYFLFPTVADGKGTTSDLVGGTNLAFAMSAKNEYPEETVALLKEFASVETADDLVTLSGRLTATKYTYDPEKVGPLTIEAAGVLDQATAIQLYYDQYLPPDMATAHLDITAALFAKMTDPEQAAQDTEAAAAKYLQ